MSCQQGSQVPGRQLLSCPQGSRQTHREMCGAAEGGCPNCQYQAERGRSKQHYLYSVMLAQPPGSRPRRYRTAAPVHPSTVHAIRDCCAYLPPDIGYGTTITSPTSNSDRKRTRLNSSHLG